MKAKEMFEELGFRNYIVSKSITGNKNVKVQYGNVVMTFTYCVNGNYVFNVPNISSVKVLQAIHQQMKELEWIK